MLHILVGVLAASWNLFSVMASRIKILQTLLPPKWPRLTKCPSTHWAKPVQRGALQCLQAGSAGYEEGRARWIPQNSKCFSSCSSNSAQAYSLGCWTQDFVLSFSGRGFEHFPAKTVMQINLRHRNYYKHLVWSSLFSVSLDPSDHITRSKYPSLFLRLLLLTI